ncbi:hypothetical protein DEO72_LG2g3511 [Vigna unguiculata]|uniref:Uncharacterized protein n=1 Tax=Vigna unguiculata TaxID=3917 RepID=A0A4D6L3W9_VIGUN|nr:hypothetical protein DEO72_LG2g3511 [Vigna unguiculata]
MNGVDEAKYRCGCGGFAWWTASSITVSCEKMVATLVQVLPKVLDCSDELQAQNMQVSRARVVWQWRFRQRDDWRRWRREEEEKRSVLSCSR